MLFKGLLVKTILGWSMLFKFQFAEPIPGSENSWSKWDVTKSTDFVLSTPNEHSLAKVHLCEMFLRNGSYPQVALTSDKRLLDVFCEVWWHWKSTLTQTNNKHRSTSQYRGGHWCAPSVTKHSYLACCSIPCSTTAGQQKAFRFRHSIRLYCLSRHHVLLSIAIRVLFGA